MRIAVIGKSEYLKASQKKLTELGHEVLMLDGDCKVSFPDKLDLLLCHIQISSHGASKAAMSEAKKRNVPLVLVRGMTSMLQEIEAWQQQQKTKGDAAPKAPSEWATAVAKVVAKKPSHKPEPAPEVQPSPEPEAQKSLPALLTTKAPDWIMMQESVLELSVQVEALAKRLDALDSWSFQKQCDILNLRASVRDLTKQIAPGPRGMDLFLKVEALREKGITHASMVAHIQADKDLSQGVKGFDALELFERLRAQNITRESLQLHLDALKDLEG